MLDVLLKMRTLVFLSVVCITDMEQILERFFCKWGPQIPEYFKVFLKPSLTNLIEIRIGHCVIEAFNLDQFPAMHLADFKLHFVGTPLRPYAR